MITSSTSRQQLLAQKSYLQARVSNYYTSNISAGDHIKFNSIVNSNGTDITLDTSTTYTSTAGVASVGRFTLKAGKTYRLYTTVQGNGATGINATFIWYNSTSDSAIPGSRAYALSPAFSGGNGPIPEATAFITPQVDTLVEVRINTVSDINTIEGADSNDNTFAIIETVEQTIPVETGVPISRIRRRGGTTRGSSNTNVIIYATAEELNGTSLTYSNDATNGDSFIVNTSGIYAVSLTAESTTNDGTLIICVGSTIVNSPVGTSSLRTFLDVSGNRCSIAWTGYVEAGQKIWAAFSTTTLNSNSYDNQISIAGPL